MPRLWFRRSAAAVLILLPGAAGVGWWSSRPSQAEAVWRAPAQEPDAEPVAGQANVVKQGFPAATADATDLTRSDSAWEIEWDITNANNGAGVYSSPSSVLAIRSAKFMYKDKMGRPRWITVVRNLEIGEVFVPYDPGSPRYNDVSQMPFWIVRADPKMLGPNCVAPGVILPSADPAKKNKVYKEVHDDGPRWIADLGYTGQDRCRRGEKMMIWCVFYGANYRYIFEYGFSDDGVIACRLGATARNLLPRQASQADVHLHVGCWRFDPDLGDPTALALGGPEHNVVQLVRRLPQTPDLDEGKYYVDVKPFGAGRDGLAREGFALWRAEEFTTLRIESTVRKNGNPTPYPTSYDLVPLRSGSVRNLPAEYDFVNKDFWVTLVDPSHTTFTQVPTYATQRQPLDKKAVTVWHNSPLIHVPRAEDFGVDGRSNVMGVALTSWSGFLLKPRNLGDSTPLYVPVPRIPRGIPIEDQ